jgi:hypothetical protein
MLGRVGGFDTSALPFSTRRRSEAFTRPPCRRSSRFRGADAGPCQFQDRRVVYHAVDRRGRGHGPLKILSHSEKTRLLVTTTERRS